MLVVSVRHLGDYAEEQRRHKGKLLGVNRYRDHITKELRAGREKHLLTNTHHTKQSPKKRDRSYTCSCKVSHLPTSLYVTKHRGLGWLVWYIIVIIVIITIHPLYNIKQASKCSRAADGKLKTNYLCASVLVRETTLECAKKGD